MRLEIQDLWAGYGEVTALRSVNLTVPDGGVVALLGPNGAGKTTLLKVASGLLRPRRGRLLLDGEDITGEPAERIAARGICHVTEGRSVFPGLTVKENLRMFADPKDEKTCIDRAVDAFPKLGKRMSQIAGTMSGGEQQMLALARAYVQRPKVVLLDEVSMGLAPIVVDEIFEFLARLVADGASLLLVEQYVAKALALADTLYLLVRSRVAFAGEPGELHGTDLFAQYLDATA
jgi:branched-chain amino acid transport system ATP-binding protein